MVELNGAEVRIRRAGVGDAPGVVGLFDDAIAWFREIGNAGQWGSEPFSAQPRRVAHVRGLCGEPGARVAEGAGELLGTVVLGEAQEYVAPVDGELYVRLLIAARTARARGVGRMLLGFAEEQARELGRELLRVDCYAGGSGRLVGFYESCGFTRAGTFSVGTWPGQLLERRVPRAS